MPIWRGVLVPARGEIQPARAGAARGPEVHVTDATKVRAEKGLLLMGNVMLTKTEEPPFAEPCEPRLTMQQITREAAENRKHDAQLGNEHNEAI
jgi:hypothetical protein